MTDLGKSSEKNFITESENMGKFKHHSYFAMVKNTQAFRFPFVCLNCRKSFKQPVSMTTRKCPICTQPMIMLSRKFSAPATKDKQQWLKVKNLVEHGFRFYSVHETDSRGSKNRVQYPATIEGAKEFVLRYQPQS